MDAHPIRRLGVRVLTAAAFTAGIGALLLLAGSVENSAQFSRWQPWILLFSICGAVALMVLLTRKLWQLYRDFRDHVPGSRLAMRTVLMFGCAGDRAAADRVSVLARFHQPRHRQLVSRRDQAGAERCRGAVALGAGSAAARAGAAHRDPGALAARAAGSSRCCSGSTRNGAPPKQKRSRVRRLRPRRRGQQRHTADAAAGAIAAGSGAAAGRRTQLRQPDSARQRPIHHRNRGADPGRGLGARRSHATC